MYAFQPPPDYIFYFDGAEEYGESIKAVRSILPYSRMVGQTKILPVFLGNPHPSFYIKLVDRNNDTNCIYLHISCVNLYLLGIGNKEKQGFLYFPDQYLIAAGPNATLSLDRTLPTRSSYYDLEDNSTNLNRSNNEKKKKVKGEKSAKKDNDVKKGDQNIFIDRLDYGGNEIRKAITELSTFIGLPYDERREIIHHTKFRKNVLVILITICEAIRLEPVRREIMEVYDYGRKLSAKTIEMPKDWDKLSKQLRDGVINDDLGVALFVEYSPKKGKSLDRKSSRDNDQSPKGRGPRNLGGHMKGEQSKVKEKQKKPDPKEDSNSPHPFRGHSHLVEVIPYALAEMTKRSTYFEQIEEDVKNHAYSIELVKVAIRSFPTSDMAELLKFQKYVESQLGKLIDEIQSSHGSVWSRQLVCLVARNLLKLLLQIRKQLLPNQSTTKEMKQGRAKTSKPVEPEDVEPAEMTLEEIESRLGSVTQPETTSQLKSSLWKECPEAIVSFKEQVESLQNLDQSVEILIRLSCAVPGCNEKNVQVQQQVIDFITDI